MCGICGVQAQYGQPVDEAMLQHMTQTLIHRGPDDDGYYVDGSTGFGFRRLAIVDVQAGHQPLSNEDGSVWVVFNGEIYNYKALRQELVQSGHRFQTDSDTEVIVHLFEARGISMLQELRGMFAIALYDANTRRLYLARDHFGIKPLYYANVDGTFLFASEIKSLLASQYVRAAVDAQSLWHYMTFQYVPEPNTLFRGISKLPPAHYLCLENGHVRTERYWTAQFQPDESRPLSYFVEGIESKLKETVEAHMMGDVPTGAFLSSGVDSSAIAAIMRQRQPIQTFSVGFEQSAADMNELTWARQTSRKLNTDHHDVLISAQRYQSELPRLIYGQEDPIADPSAIALHFVAEVASSYVKVVLSGEGADEVFGGYPIYHEPLSLRLFDYLPMSVRRRLGAMADLLPTVKGKGFLQRGAVPLERRFVGNANIFSDASKRRILPFADQPGLSSSFSVTDPWYEASAHLDAITRMQTVDIHTWLPGDILAKADKMSMLNSLEVRVPFLDRELFEFAATVPARYRIAKGTTKYVLREALRSILPDDIRHRPKLGFPVPIAQWLRGPMFDFVWDVIQSSKADEWIDRAYVSRLLQDHRSGTANHSREIWTAVTFMIWHQVFIEQQYAFAPGISPRVSVRRRRMESIAVDDLAGRRLERRHVPSG